MENITKRQIEIFLAVCESENMKKAANKLYLSHSAVSTAINQFETQLGCFVFDRVGREVKLNQKGAYLKDKLAPILKELSFHLKSVGKDEFQEKFIIGASTTIGNYLLPQLMSSFMEKEKVSPDFELIIENTEQISKRVSENKIDLGLVEGPVFKTNVTTEFWMDDELIVVQSYSSNRGLNEPISIHKLKNECWIMREPGSGTQSTIDAKLMEFGLSLSNIKVISQTEAIKQAVASELGIACISRVCVSKELDFKSLSEISLKESIVRPFSFVLPINRKLSKGMLRFIEFCKETVCVYPDFRI